jgi:ammonia channel protein AmtB
MMFNSQIFQLHLKYKIGKLNVELFDSNECILCSATGFLWVFFPSFNSANAYGVDARNRAIVNTYTALIGSTIAAFIASSFFNKNEVKFSE